MVRGEYLGELNEESPHPYNLEMACRDFLWKFFIIFCIVLLYYKANELLKTELHLLSSETSHRFSNIKQKLCANVPKGSSKIILSSVILIFCDFIDFFVCLLYCEMLHVCNTITKTQMFAIFTGSKRVAILCYSV